MNTYAHTLHYDYFVRLFQSDVSLHLLSYIFTRPKEFVAYLLDVATKHNVPVLNIKRMGTVIASALGVRRVAAFAIVCTGLWCIHTLPPCSLANEMCFTYSCSDPIAWTTSRLTHSSSSFSQPRPDGHPNLTLPIFGMAVMPS